MLPGEKYPCDLHDLAHFLRLGVYSIDADPAQHLGTAGAGCTVDDLDDLDGLDYLDYDLSV